MTKEKIYYTKSKTIEEEFEVEVDIDNCFLFSEYSTWDNHCINRYFGVYFEEEYAKFRKIVTFERVDFGFKLETKDHPRGLNGASINIKNFFKDNKNVQVITKEEFMKKYNEIKAKL